ncbi:MAG: hypothetical protein JWQ14_2684 [Adhaeribacter sp.]|nr:hypothetical protein [Adhaeribacter sp.]
MKRIIQLDFFRGFFLILITTNHFLSWQNIIHRFTHEFIGWVTAAEGFVFLSGLTAGIVSSRKLVEHGGVYILIAAIKRAWTIYKYHLVLFLLVAIIFYSHSVMEDYWYQNYSDFELLFQKPLFSVLLTGLLLYQPIYMDILPMYALFVLLLPFTLKGFQNGQAGTILIISFLVYLMGIFDLQSAFFHYFEFFEFIDKVDTGFFNLLSWQILFIAGLYFGFLTYQNRISGILQNKRLIYSAVSICVLLFLTKTLDSLLDSSALDLDFWVSKENLGPIRLLNFSALAVVFSFLASRYKQWFSFKPVCYLGKYSLEVFSFHILLIVIFKPIKDIINNLYTIRLMDGLYIKPGSTLMLLFILIPALFLAPGIKNYINQYKLKVKSVPK